MTYKAPSCASLTWCVDTWSSLFGMGQHHFYHSLALQFPHLFYNGIKSLAFWLCMSCVWTIQLLLSEAYHFGVSLVSVLPNFGCFFLGRCFILETRSIWCISKGFRVQTDPELSTITALCPLALSHKLDPTESLPIRLLPHPHIGLPHFNWHFGVSIFLGDSLSIQMVVCAYIFEDLWRSQGFSFPWF